MSLTQNHSRYSTWYVSIINIFFKNVYYKYVRICLIQVYYILVFVNDIKFKKMKTFLWTEIKEKKYISIYHQISWIYHKT